MKALSRDVRNDEWIKCDTGCERLYMELIVLVFLNPAGSYISSCSCYVAASAFDMVPLSACLSAIVHQSATPLSNLSLGIYCRHLCNSMMILRLHTLFYSAEYSMNRRQTVDCTRKLYDKNATIFICYLDIS